MEFTEAIPAFGGRAVLSPSGRLLARLTPSADFILLVQSTDTLSVVFSTPVPLLMDNDAASTIPKSKHFPPPRPRRILPQDIRLTWSPDSQKLMIVDGPVNRVFIYNLAVPEVEEAGFILQESMPTSRFFWSPRSDHVVSVLDYRIGLRVWSLDARYPIRAITGIKSSGDTGIDFCAEGNMMAVLHRKEGLDVIVIYSCSTWDALQVLRPPEASFLDDVRFATGLYARNDASERPLLYAWELPCLSSRMFIFEPDGSCRIVQVSGGQSDYQESLGFSRVVFSQRCELAALTSDDGQIVLWNTLLHKPITKIGVTADLSQLPDLIAFKERVVYSEGAKSVRYESGYDLLMSELHRTASTSAPVLQLKFSRDAHFLAIHSSYFPDYLWIYSIPSLAFTAVLCQLPRSAGAVKDFDWHPELPLLSLVTGSEYVYFWQPEGCHCIPQPFEDAEERCTRGVVWSRSEQSLMLLAGPMSCCLAVPDFVQ